MIPSNDDSPAVTLITGKGRHRVRLVGDRLIGDKFNMPLVRCRPIWKVRLIDHITTEIPAREYWRNEIAETQRRQREQAEAERKSAESEKVARRALFDSLPTILAVDHGAIKWHDNSLWVVTSNQIEPLAQKTRVQLHTRLKRRCPEYQAWSDARQQERKALSEMRKAHAEARRQHRLALPPRIERTELYSVPELKDRGWTDAAIRRFLPTEPDATRPNPKYENAGAPMRMWLASRVEQAEEAESFRTWLKQSEKRREAALKAVLTREDNIEQRVRNADITIKAGLSNKDIYRLALTTHGGNYVGDPGEFQWSNRTARNCIRHNLTNYETLWAMINRGETGRAGYDLLRKRVDALIDATYPQFAEGQPEVAPM